jgi:hypothetical protein
MAAASTILSNLPRHVREAVRFYWQTRTKQLEKQAGSGAKDAKTEVGTNCNHLRWLKFLAWQTPQPKTGRE